jgi:hypothetical protein
VNNTFEEHMEENASLLQRMSPTPLSRRKVLLGGGAGALALVAAACGGDDAAQPDSTGEPETAAGGGGDVAKARFAASLEVLAVNTYQAALDAGLDYPPAVAEFATTAQRHHQEALDAWNELLTTLGETEVTEPPAELDATVSEALAEVPNAENPVVAVAELALLLEQTAADTYFEAIPTIENPEALALAASIQPVDMQHAAVLNYVMGNYPVPETFANTEMSAIPA